MEELDDNKLKAEIDEITKRVETIMSRIEMSEIIESNEVNQDKDQ